jgi:hypothetical protein
VDNLVDNPTEDMCKSHLFGSKFKHSLNNGGSSEQSVCCVNLIVIISVGSNKWNCW